MTAALQIENVFAPVLAINTATAQARYTETASGIGWTSANPPERIFQRDQAIDFSVSFTVSGLMQTLLAGCSWRVSLFAERYGPSEFAFPPAVGEHFRPISIGEATPAPVTYTIPFTIPSFTFPSSVYDLVCMVRLITPGGFPLPVAMFADFPTIEVYSA